MIHGWIKVGKSTNVKFLVYLRRFAFTNETEIFAKVKCIRANINMQPTKVDICSDSLDCLKAFDVEAVVKYKVVLWTHIALLL